MAIPADATIRRAKSFPFCGRLVSLPTTTAGASAPGAAEALSVDFPAMPDTIELARGTDYFVSSNIFMPDGIHQYKGTKPLEIPFSFQLHAMDDVFCPNGSYTLMQVAARLHSFTLPLDASGGNTTAYAKAGKSDEAADTNLEHNSASASDVRGLVTVGADKIFMPVTCRLELIFTDDDAPGIACTGYVREVSVKLKGPWLRGPGKSYNLPSAGDFSFVFVHLPGQRIGNSLNRESDVFMNRQPQAYAHDVKDKFYNTRALAEAPSTGFDVPDVLAARHKQQQEESKAAAATPKGSRVTTEQQLRKLGFTSEPTAPTQTSSSLTPVPFGWGSGR